MIATRLTSARMHADTRILSLEAASARESVLTVRPDLATSSKPLRLLIVGFGTGEEGTSLGSAFNAGITAIDVVEPVIRASGVNYVLADGRAMPFNDSSFHIVYSNHVIEHIPTPERAVREIERVLHRDGVAYLGTPNRWRIVGYLGGGRGASILDKLRWNLADYWARLRGRFRNELGAHAGFSEPELVALARAAFPSVTPARDTYYARKYPRIARLISWFAPVGVAHLVWPSTYVVCTKGPGSR